MVCLEKNKVMNRFLLGAFLCLLSIISRGGDNANGLNQPKNDKKLAFFEYKFAQGEYEECIDGANKFAKSYDKGKVSISDAVRARLLEARSYFSMMSFEKAGQTFNAALNLAEKSRGQPMDEHKCLLYIARYLNETGNYSEEENILHQIEKISGIDKASTEELNFLLALAELYKNQGFCFKALEIIDGQEPYRLKMASSQLVEDKDKAAQDKAIDFQTRKETYLHLLNLKAGCLFEVGKTSEAEMLIKNNLLWGNKNLSSANRFVIETLRGEAEQLDKKRSFARSAIAYSHCYGRSEAAEYESSKVEDLVNQTIESIKDGQIIQYRNHLRRLQMYAFRSIGTKDRYEIAYSYCDAFRSFYEGDLDAAESRLNSLSTIIKFLPPYHSYQYKTLQLQADLKLRQGDLKSYKNVLSLIAEFNSKFKGNKSPDFYKANIDLAFYELNYGSDLNKAEKLFVTNYSSHLKKEITKESDLNIFYLKTFARLLEKRDKPDSAIIVMKDVVASSVAQHGEKSPEYAAGIAKLGELQILSGKYEEGFSSMQKAEIAIESGKDNASEQLMEAYLIISRMYAFKGEFDKSKNLLNKVTHLNLDKSGFDPLADALEHEQEASLYLMTGNYYKGEKEVKKSLEIKERILEGGSLQLLSVYETLARLFLINGNYNLSDQYLKHSKEIVDKVFDKQSLQQAEILLMQGDYFNEIGDYKKAEEAYAKADEIFLSKLGKENLNRVETLSKLAAIKYKRGIKVAEVEKLYQEAGKIIQKSAGENNPLYALHLQKLAEFYIQLKRTEEAEKFLSEAERYWDKKIGSENKYNAEIKLLQGDIAYNKEKFDFAEKNYQKSRQLFSAIFNEKHPGYIQATGKLARVQYMVKGYEKSLELMEEIIPKYLDYTRNYFPSLSFREKSKFWSKMKDEFEFYNFLALDVFGNKKARLSGEVYNNTIATKALLLNSNIKLREQIMNSKDSVLIGMYNEWIILSESLTSSLSYTKEQLAAQKLDPHHIEASIEHLEKEMSKRSTLFNGEEIKRRATWKEIRASLHENEHAVEMVRYRFFNKVFTDSIVYAALVVNKHSSEFPDVVAFSNGNAMEKKFLKYYRNAANMNINDQYSYETYWKNIKTKIPDGATVYFSSEGVYNQLNLEMMPAPDGSFVLEKNQIVLVTNTKDLLGVIENKKKNNSKDVKKTHTEEYLLCGNPDFYSEKDKVKSAMVVSLPGAEKEVNELTTLLSGTGKRTVKVLSNHVTEDTISSFFNPKVFHIATHGYFKETTNRANDDDFASNPLLNSGLMLSGAGEIISNTENTYVNQKDGILTAYEAMNLNFASTELVVLSACETGRGDVQVGEGVYGLQRSFLIAGADAVIMSLFKVNDEITQKLMFSFYKKWIESGNKRKAFLEAKREIRKAYDNPLSWGSFIMIEGRPYREQTLQALVKE